MPAKQHVFIPMTRASAFKELVRIVNGNVGTACILFEEYYHRQTFVISDVVAWCKEVAGLDNFQITEVVQWINKVHLGYVDDRADQRIYQTPRSLILARRATEGLKRMIKKEEREENYN